ncbi:hypothetical protein B0F90DRAFT_1817442 [Multifurca ochricompacta]|uniref:Uncharacterized protein n=1 Tax=Multifurca ochricompacta TaxID=376703 RepID=A0AAD4M4A4_9AGAM|nr:hypothetical protein B0F90DRAFT_1817442 [Multifurca ochricompacta]
MTRKKSSTCHIGVAFYSHPAFPTQWVLVLSDNPLFEGHVWCSTAVETVNGWGASWTPCDSSPSAFNQIALFSGIVHVTRVSMTMNKMQTSISKSNLASEVDRFEVQGDEDIPYDTERYVVLALLRLCEGRSISLPKLEPKSLGNYIRGRFPDVEEAQRPAVSNMYPVVSLESGKVSYGRS